MLVVITMTVKFDFGFIYKRNRVVFIEFVVLWIVPPFSVAIGFQRFGGLCFLHLQSWNLVSILFTPALFQFTHSVYLNVIICTLFARISNLIIHMLVIIQKV